jgi:hypothetical protein
VARSAHRVDAQRQQVALPLRAASVSASSAPAPWRRRAWRGSAAAARSGLAHLDVVDLADVDRVLLGSLYLLTPTITSLPAVDARLLLGRAGLDLQLGPAAVHGLGHAAHGLDLFDDGPGLVGHLLRQRLHHVAAGPGVDHVGDVRLFLDDQLRVARDAGAELGGQRDGLVEAVGVQALRAAEHRRHGLDGGAHDVVVRVLLGQAPAAGLAVRAQHQALGVLRAEALHDARPQQPRRAHLGDLEIEVHPDRPEEAQAAGEVVHVQALGQRGLHVLLAVGQREGQFQRLVRAGFLHVVAEMLIELNFGICCAVYSMMSPTIRISARAGRCRCCGP